MVVNFELKEIEKIAAEFLSLTGDKKVIAFHGEMGAGKTTLIHALCKVLMVKDVVSSPTFSIINEYKTGAGDILYHLDLYRLKDEKEAIAAGVEDCLYSGNLCMIEWPEKAGKIIPNDTVHCYLKLVSHNERKLQINL
jgi:tRNA threonylcarbamoyladenosine biosynthesis protein TsaE